MLVLLQLTCINCIIGSGVFFCDDTLQKEAQGSVISHPVALKLLLIVLQ